MARIVGTSGADVLSGASTPEADVILGKGGEDTIGGSSGDDRLVGGAGNDRLTDTATGNDIFKGGAGNDLIVTNMGNDSIDGGTGFDSLGVNAPANILFISAHLDGKIRFYDNATGSPPPVSTMSVTGIEALNFSLPSATVSIRIFGNGVGNTLQGWAGDDIIRGYGGADSLHGHDGDDIIRGGRGNDSLSGDFPGVGSGNDRLFGGSGKDLLGGGGGDDRMFGGGGNDTLRGDAGEDLIVGGGGADILFGGSDADTFRFNRLNDSQPAALRDRIADFEKRMDVVDLTRIDADTTAAGNQAFAFVGTAAFSGAAGELRAGSLKGNTVIQADVNGDQVADFEIELFSTSGVNLAIVDFLL